MTTIATFQSLVTQAQQLADKVSIDEKSATEAREVIGKLKQGIADIHYNQSSKNKDIRAAAEAALDLVRFAEQHLMHLEQKLASRSVTFSVGPSTKLGMLSGTVAMAYSLGWLGATRNAAQGIYAKAAAFAGESYSSMANVLRDVSSTVQGVYLSVTRSIEEVVSTAMEVPQTIYSYFSHDDEAFYYTADMDVENSPYTSLKWSVAVGIGAFMLLRMYDCWR